MGVVMSRVRKKANEEFAATRALVRTSRDWPAVVGVVSELVATMNAEYDTARASTTVMGRWWRNGTGSPDNFHYYVSISQDNTRGYVSYGTTVEHILAQGSRHSMIIPDWWLADIVLDLRTGIVSLGLSRWVLEDSGKIKRASCYTDFGDRLVSALTQDEEA